MPAVRQLNRCLLWWHSSVACSRPSHFPASDVVHRCSNNTVASTTCLSSIYCGVHHRCSSSNGFQIKIPLHNLQSAVNNRASFVQGGIVQRRLLETRRYRHRSSTYLQLNREDVFEGPKKSLDRNKDPVIPEGHPIDTDSRPIGNVIPDFDIELPAFSWRGHISDFKAWEDPPVIETTNWPEIARYDYDELAIRNFPVVYEVNLVYAINVLCVITLIISIVGTKWSTHSYYKKHGDYYKTGWPHFHYEPRWDIVPLTEREDGLPPETLILTVEDPAFVRHEWPAEPPTEEGMEDHEIDETIREEALKAADAGAVDTALEQTTGGSIDEME